MRKLIILLLSAFIYTLPCTGQTGFPRFASIENDGFDNINRYNLNNQFAIPIVSIAGRGLTFSPKLSYNSLIWQKYFNLWTPVVDSNGAPTWGWDSQNTIGGATFVKRRYRCVANDGSNEWAYGYDTFDYLDQSGTHHSFNLSFAIAEITDLYPECGDSNQQWSAYAADGSGYYLVASEAGNTIEAKVYAPTGSGISDSVMSDTNGNRITSSAVSGTETDWHDSTGRLALKVVTDVTSTPHTTTYSYRDASGNWQNYVVKLTSYSILTAFGCPGMSEYGNSSVWLPYEIDLPSPTNNGKYLIEYENTPGSSGNTTGRISKVSLPAGGYIQYAYSGVNCDDGSPTSMTKLMNDGSSSSSWTYTRSLNASLWSTTLKTPNTSGGNDAVYTFNSSGLPTDVKFYQGTGVSGTLLQEIGTTYNTGYYGISAYTTTTTTGSALTKNTQSFDLHGNLTGLVEYDTDGTTVLRNTSYTYLSDSQHDAANIVDKVASVIVSDGGGTAVAKTVTTYDDYSSVGLSCVTGASGHNDSNYECSNTVRGNLTKTVQYSSPANSTGAITTQAAYDSLGNVISVTDANSNSTTISYADAWGGSNPCSASNTYAYPTLVTNPLSQSTSASYNSCTGALTSSKDANNQTTTYSYNDPLLRLTNVGYPDGGGITNSYTSTQVAAQVAGGAGQTTTIDGLGRTLHVQAAGATVDYGYNFDAQGPMQSVSNPYTSGTAPSTTTHYDALGRRKSIDFADSISHANANYADNCTTVTDESSHSRKLCADALGRLKQVNEDPNGLNIATTYTYNTIDKLTDVLQSGGAARHFTYDGVSRIITASSPEAGTTCYGTWSGSNCVGGYDLNGNLLYKTDARLVVSSYTYDVLNRLTQKTYSDGTPATYYTYDNFTGWGQPHGASIGRLARAWTCGPQGCEDDLYSYDPMGRVNHIEGATPSEAGHAAHWIGMQYDLAGNMTDLLYPHGRVVHQAFDSVGRLTSVSYATQSTPYGSFTGGTSINTPYISNIGYHPDGSLATLQYGNGVTSQIDLNTRLQTQSIQATLNASGLNGQTAFSSLYCYTNCPGQPIANNGNILHIGDLLNNGRTQDFSYDSLNRITNFWIGGSPTQQFQSDSFGNMSQTVSGSPVYSFNAKNQISNLPCSGALPAYDLTGNQTCDSDPYGAPRAQSYDAENRLNSIRMSGASQPFVSYTYAADSSRVRKTNSNGTWSESIYVNGQPITEQNSDGSYTDYIYANGQKIARVASTFPQMHLHGSYPTGGCSTNMMQSGLGSYQYPIKTQDKLVFDQKNTSAVGGLVLIPFSGPWTTSQISDQNNVPMSQQGDTGGAWKHRVIDLTSLAGETINGFWPITTPGTPAGSWDESFAHAGIVSIDGTVTPIFWGQSISWSASESCGSSTSTLAVEAAPVDSSSWQEATTYNASDHLGTSRLELSSGGWPEARSEYTPFGQRLDAQLAQTSYTGLEHDQESGLDHTMFRQLSSTQGRWTSPDPYLGSIDLTNPQSLNRYAYVANNPLRWSDPTGLNFLECSDMGGDYSDGDGGVIHIEDWECTEDSGGGSGATIGLADDSGEGPPTAAAAAAPIAPNKPTTTKCSGSATFRGVGGNQAHADGAFFSKYPQITGGSIRGGTFGTVAVQNNFLGLSTKQFRMHGTQIFITPSNQSLIFQYGGPTGPLSVSDYGDPNIQATPGVAFDIYRFPTVAAGNQFGKQTMPITISFPNSSGASCPAGFTVVP